MMQALTICVVALAANAAAGEPICIQGEDFVCDGKTWAVRDQVGRYAPDSGLKHLWGAQGGQGIATKTVTLERAGRYFVWVRHTVMRGRGPGCRGAFRVTLEQGGAVLAQASFDEHPPAKPPRYIHRYDYSRFQAELPAGPVRIELSKLPPLVCSGWTRYVDHFVLTTDPKYVPKPSDFQPKTWLRVKLGPTQTTPIYIHCFCDHFRAPWYMHFSLSKDGFERGVRPRRGEAAYLEAGEATPWCDITPAIHEDRGARMQLRGAVRYAYYKEWLPSLDATFEFATAPNDAAVLKRFHRKGPGAGLCIITPGVLTKDSVGKLKADYEYADEAAAFAKTLPKVTFGKRPERFPFILSMRLLPGLYDPKVRQTEYGIAAQMGFNGTYDRLDATTRALGFRFTRSGTTSWYMDNGCYLQPQTERIKEKIAAVAEGGPTLVMFMDEPSAKPLAHAAGCTRCGEVFRTWLRDELRVPLARLGVKSWDEVKPVTKQAKAVQPALYYYSQRFRIKAFADFLRLQTRTITNAFAGAPPATVNFSDGAVYRANMYALGVDYFHIFKSQALTMAWSEDWSNISSTYECCGYNVELLRAATKYHGQPIGMYVITSYGRTPLDVKLKAYSSLGRGAKVLQSFAYGPTYANHEPNWYMRRDMYVPMTELCHEIGGAEDLLVEAKRVPSEVAFLYSTASDIWTAGQTSLYGHDRMHSYLALTHAQVPVDFLSEEDVAEGRLKPYKALYVFGPNLLAEAVEPIAYWVRAGGTLYLAAGAAVADELNRPSSALDRRLGLRRGRVHVFQEVNWPGRYLARLDAHGKVKLGAAEADVLGVRQALDSGETLARFDDGAAAVVQQRCGAGTVFAAGFMPGLSYIRTALLARDALGAQTPNAGDHLPADPEVCFSTLKPQELSYNPWQYPTAERELLLRPVQQAGVTRPVELNHPLVESFYLEAAKGAVVTLANYRLQRIENLRVAVRTPHKVTRVESVRRGALAFTVEAGRVVVKLPLRGTDMLKVYW